jgi:hypothetical protein
MHQVLLQGLFVFMTKNADIQCYCFRTHVILGCSVAMTQYVYLSGGSAMVLMTVVMVQMSLAVDRTGIPLVFQTLLHLLLQEHAVRIISVVIMVSCICNKFVSVIN